METLTNSQRFQRFMNLVSPMSIPAIGVLYLCSLSRNWRPEPDSAVHLILARSILAGHGYTYLGYPGLKYPFGFAFLISPIMWLTNSSFLALNLFMLVLTGLAFWGVYVTFGKVVPHAYALLLTFLTAWSSLALFNAGYIMTDLPYMASSFLALYFVLAYVKERGVACGIFAAAFMLASVFLRLVGISLITGTVLFALVVKRSLFVTKQFWILCATLIIPIAAWVAHTQFAVVDPHDPVWQMGEFIVSREEVQRDQLRDPTSQVRGIAGAVKRGAENLVYYGGVSYSALTGIPTDPSKENLRRLSSVHLAFIGMIALTLFIGMLRRVLYSPSLLDFYFISYMVILLAWAARESRYLLPVLPFLIDYFLGGLIRVAGILHGSLTSAHKNLPNLAFACLTAFCGLYLPANTWLDIDIIKAQHADPYYSQKWSDYFQASEWLKANTKIDARIVGVAAPIAALFSDRWCVTFPHVEDQHRLLAFLGETRADYLLISPGRVHEERYLLSLIDKNSILFQKEFVQGSTSIYRINRDQISRQLAE